MIKQPFPLMLGTLLALSVLSVLMLGCEKPQPLTPGLYIFSPTIPRDQSSDQIRSAIRKVKSLLRLKLNTDGTYEQKLYAENCIRKFTTGRWEQKEATLHLKPSQEGNTLNCDSTQIEWNTMDKPTDEDFELRKVSAESFEVSKKLGDKKAAWALFIKDE